MLAEVSSGGRLPTLPVTRVLFSETGGRREATDSTLGEAFLDEPKTLLKNPGLFSFSFEVGVGVDMTMGNVCPLADVPCLIPVDSRS